MTHLTKPVKRTTAAMVREAGQARPVIVILQPPNLLGFRAKGCRKTYYLPAESCWSLAVKAETAAIQKQKRLEKQKSKRFAVCKL